MGVFRPRSWIGLDLGSHRLKAVEVVAHNGGCTIAHMGMTATPPGAVSEGSAANPEVLAPAIRALLSEAGIRGRQAVTALGGEAVVIREIKLPEMPEEELHRAVTFEAERFLPGGVGGVSRDFQVFGKAPDDGQLEILLVAAPKTLVERQLASLQMTGLAAPVLDVTMFSVMRAVATPDAAAQAAAYVDLGAQSSDILISEGERLWLARNIPVGGDALTNAIADALKIDPPTAQTLKEEHARLLLAGEQPEDPTVARYHEAILPVVTSLATEIRRSLTFYRGRSRGQPIARIILTGGTAKLGNLAPFLSEQLGLPVELGNPFTTCPADAAFPSDYLADVGPTMAVAVGLALRGLRK